MAVKPKKKALVKAPPAKPKPRPSGGEDRVPKGKLQSFAIDMVRFHPDLQPRKGDASTPVGGLYADHVADLRKALKAGAKLPPAQVWSVPGEGNLVTDGHHSIEAARQEGLKQFNCEVHEGTMLDAVLAMGRANPHDAAPLKLTNDEKRSKVTLTLLALRKAGKAWSNSKVAEHCNVSDDLVASCLMRLPADPSLPKGEPAKKVGKDGKEYAPEAGKNPKKKAEEKPEPPAPQHVANDRASAAMAAVKFDLAAAEGKIGAVDRELDVLANLHGVKHTPRAEGIRRLLREFKSAFVEWHGELVAKGVTK